MFEYSKNLMQKIKNKENLQPNELMTIERSLRLYEVNNEMLDYQTGVSSTNSYELTEHFETMGCRQPVPHII